MVSEGWLLDLSPIRHSTMVQTHKHLYPQICAFENLYRAHRLARRGGKCKHAPVAEFEYATFTMLTAPSRGGLP